MTRNTKELTLDRIADRLSYDPLTGEIRWVKHYHKRLVGRIAGTTQRTGYMAVKLDYQWFLAHRIAWVLSYGSISTDMEIDHIDRNRTNNRLSNLRLVTLQENQQNRHTRLGEWSARGYTLNKSGRYVAQSRGNYLGTFPTKELAIARFEEFKKNRLTA